TKNLGAWGDAGAIVTSDDAVAVRLRRLRAHGAVAPYVHGEQGRNSRMDALQAAVLLVKSRHLARWQQARARLAARYVTELSGLPVTLPHVPASPAVHAWHAFVVRTPRSDALAASLRDRGVESRVYYPVPLHLQECFRALGEPPMPVAERACREALAIPFFPAMTEAQQAQVVAAVRAFFG
ncbi:MAG TPA: DegT/DnrJ/EryC1/StrS family aminotransferase, partial [Polyangiaceae bacterium]